MRSYCCSAIGLLALHVLLCPSAFAGGGPPVASITGQTDASCNGGADGSLTVSVTDGVSPFSYQWSDGAFTPSTLSTSDTNSFLVAGTYTVTVTDNNSAIDTATGTVNEPAALVATAMVENNESCFGSSADGAVSATVSGGEPGYGYLWSNGANGPQVNGLTAGTYTVTVTDANGCAMTDSAPINGVYTNTVPFDGASINRRPQEGTVIENSCADTGLIATSFTDGSRTFTAFGDTPANSTDIMGMPSEYRWVLGPGWTGAAPTALGLCFDLDDIPMPGVSDPQTAMIQLYHRPMEGTGAFSDLGSLVYNMVTNAFCLSSVPTSGEFALGSSTEMLPVSLRKFEVD